MAKKPYSPMASYEALRDVEIKIELALDANDVVALQELALYSGPKVGYKAFCYMLGDRMTAAQLKPDEACAAAYALTDSDAMTIYAQITIVHPDHPIASGNEI